LPEKKKLSMQSKRQGVALWIGLLFFVSIWMFILGIVVGRGTAPVTFDIEKLQKELAELKEAVIKRDLERFKIEPDSRGDKPDLGFHEALKHSKGDIGLLPVSPKQKPRQKVYHEEADRRTAPQSEARRRRSQTAALKRADKTPVVRNRKPAAGSQTASSEKLLAIQVLSVKDSKAADAIVAKLKKKGYPAYRIAGNVSGKGVYYRVRVGPFDHGSRADRILNRLKREGYRPFLIGR
jgi:cell division protein FtsN